MNDIEERMKQVKEIMENPDINYICVGCGLEFASEHPVIPNVDKSHRFTALCSKCYGDKEIWEKTKYIIGD